MQSATTPALIPLEAPRTRLGVSLPGAARALMNRPDTLASSLPRSLARSLARPSLAPSLAPARPAHLAWPGRRAVDTRGVVHRVSDAAAAARPVPVASPSRSPRDERRGGRRRRRRIALRLHL
ncbi:unnamed protein product [Lampetra planeri]